MAKNLTEDAVRDLARDILGLVDSDVARAGVGQLTTFNQLGFAGVADKPDGWYLPNNKAEVALVLETKATRIALGKAQVDEVLKNVRIVQTQYEKVVGVLYNGEDVRVFKGEEEVKTPDKLQHVGYYLSLYTVDSIDKERIYQLPALIVNDVGMGDPYFCKYICPQGVLEGAIPLAAANESIRAALGALFTRKLIILIAVVVLSVLFFRPFCKWICPLGAFYALMNKVSLLGIQVDTGKCVSCGKCARTCQMDVDITKSPNDTECIRCGKCIRACPTQAIRFRYGFGLSGNTNPKQVSNHQNQTEES